MKIIDSWLNSAQQVDSPNRDARPRQEDISLIVIHCISLPPGEFGGNSIRQLFTNSLDPTEHPYFSEVQHLKVSAHVLVRRTGEMIQFVPFDQRAWHAGESSYAGRAECNDFSIGIELEGTEHTSYTDRQYRQLAELIDVLLRHYPGLSRERIAGHNTISPGRKQDPGESFDWGKLYRLLAENVCYQAPPMPAVLSATD